MQNGTILKGIRAEVKRTESRVRSPESRVQSPESRVQSLEPASDPVSSARGAQKIVFVANLVASFVDSALLCSTRFVTKLATKFGLRAQPALDSDPVTSPQRARIFPAEPHPGAPGSGSKVESQRSKVRQVGGPGAPGSASDLRPSTFRPLTCGSAALGRSLSPQLIDIIPVAAVPARRDCLAWTERIQLGVC